MAPRKTKASRTAKSTAAGRGRATKKGTTATTTGTRRQVDTPQERLEGEPSTDIKGDLQRLLDRVPAEAPATGTGKAGSPLAQELRKILLSWRDFEPQDKPQKLVYLLRNRCERRKLSLAGLIANDAKKAALLDAQASKYGFHVGLAELVYHEQGPVARMPGGRGYGRGRGWGRGYGGYYGGYYGRVGCSGYMEGSDSEEDMGSDDDMLGADDDVEMEEVHETELTLKNLVDTGGKLLKAAVDFDVDTEVIPGDTQKVLVSRKHTSQSMSSNACFSLDRYYDGTALVIWPRRNHFDLLHGAQALTHACRELTASAQPKPSRDSKELVELILARAGQEECAEVVPSVCQAAIFWADADLWVRAVRKCEADSAISEMRSENIIAAIDAFGFEPVRECVERALEQDPSNQSSLQFLDTLEEKAAEDSGDAFAFAEEWVPEWRLKLAGALKAPEVDEAEIIVSTGMKLGGAKVLEKTIIPVLTPVADAAFMFAFAEQVHSTSGITVGVKKRIVKSALSSAISQADFYEETDAEYAHELAEDAIKACLETGNDASVADVVSRLVDFTGLEESVVLERGKTLLTLASAVVSLVKDQPKMKAFPALKSLSDTAIAQFLKRLATPEPEVKKEDVDAVIDASAMSSSSIQKIVEDMLTTALGESVLEILVDVFRTRRDAGTLTGVDDALASLVRKYAQVASTHGGLFLFERFGMPPPITFSLSRCIRAGVPDACLTIFDRLVQEYSTSPNSAAESLAGLRHFLPRIVRDFKGAPTDPAYSAMYKRMVTFWVDTAMTPMHAATPTLAASATALATRLAKWEKQCTCESCGELLRFLKSTKEKTSFSFIGRSKRLHMQHLMDDHLGSTFVKYEMVGTKPQSLDVAKCQAMLAPARYVAFKEEGNMCLTRLEVSEDGWKTILGADYARIVQALRGQPVPAAAPAAPSASSSALKRPATGPPATSGVTTVVHTFKRRKV